ncbi:MAG: electron transfer flavoprotein alpha subunit [Chloroflexi bacterium]|nr:MAG: electron transfer flavoprotein alpha subunit [Chloroflexota bacterium]
MSEIFVYVEHFQGIVSDITYMCLAQAQQIAKSNGGNVVAVLLGHNIELLSKDLFADEIITVSHDSLAEFTYDPFAAVLAKIIQDKQPGLMIFGDTSIGSDLAGGLSARLHLPLVSFCKEIKAEEGKLRFVAQICGGKIFAEGDLKECTSLVTLSPGKFKAKDGKTTTTPKVSAYSLPAFEKSRITLKEIILPSGEDLDISKEEILIGIGRGIENEDNVSLAKELADALGGELCASRPVIDQGWLSTSRLVGKSGKTIKPKLYLALGISGAPEHVESIEESEMIIAVNTDPEAPIFNIARYGTTENLLDISKELIRSIQKVKGG